MESRHQAELLAPSSTCCNSTTAPLPHKQCFSQPVEMSLMEEQMTKWWWDLQKEGLNFRIQSVTRNTAVSLSGWRTLWKHLQNGRIFHFFCQLILTSAAASCCHPPLANTEDSGRKTDIFLFIEKHQGIDTTSVKITQMPLYSWPQMKHKWWCQNM